jgi:hypothetical protein
LKIVGRRPVKAVKELASIPGIDVVGQVADVRPHVAGAAVVIAPLRIARGLQNKVLEAMAMAKPVVASPAALAGFGHREHFPAWAVNEPQEWVDALTYLTGATVSPRSTNFLWPVGLPWTGMWDEHPERSTAQAP